MFAIIHLLATFIADLFKSRRRLEVENLFLRHQLNIALRRAPQRVRLGAGDRCPSRKSYPHIAMVQSGKNWRGGDRSAPVASEHSVHLTPTHQRSAVGPGTRGIGAITLLASPSRQQTLSRLSDEQLDHPRLRKCCVEPARRRRLSRARPS